MPPIIGPTKRAPFIMLELSAMALGRSLRPPTRRTSSAWREGASKAFDIPSSRLPTISCQTSTRPLATSANSTDRLARGDAVGDHQYAPRLEPVDDHAGERRQQQERQLQREGGEAEHERDPVSLCTSQLTAISCSQVPICEVPWPRKKRRK